MKRDSEAGPLKRVRRHLLRRERVGLFATPAESVAAWPAPQAPGAVLRPARREDAPRLAGLMRPRDASRRLARGDLAVVAEADGRLVGCTWLTRRPMWAPHYRLRVRPGPGEGYVHGLVVDQAYRRRGLGVGLFRAIRMVGASRGVLHTTSHVQLANRPAIAVQDAGGAELRTRIYSVVVAGALGVVLSARPGDGGGPAVSPPRAALASHVRCRRSRLRHLRRAVIRRVRCDLVHVPTALADAWKSTGRRASRCAARRMPM